MKKIILFFILICFPVVVSADDERYYTIYDVKKVPEKQAPVRTGKFQNGITMEEGLNQSESAISTDLHIIKNEIRNTKNLMYRDINGFKRDF